LQGNKLLKQWSGAWEQSQKLQSRWADIFGKLADQVSFSHIQKNALVVDVTNPMWVTEIRHYEATIIGNIHTQTGEKHIQHIVARYKAKTPLKKTSAQKPQNIPLEQKIAKRWSDALQDGFNVCQGCKKRLTRETECIVCRS
jgi:hypothetical protein